MEARTKRSNWPHLRNTTKPGRWTAIKSRGEWTRGEVAYEYATQRWLRNTVILMWNWSGWHWGEMKTWTSFPRFPVMGGFNLTLRFTEGFIRVLLKPFQVVSLSLHCLFSRKRINNSVDWIDTRAVNVIRLSVGIDFPAEDHFSSRGFDDHLGNQRVWWTHNRTCSHVTVLHLSYLCLISDLKQR